VIFSADHGEMLGAHGALSKGRMWEESARVPLVARWPGRVKPGRTKALVQMFDIYPTIVEAAAGQLSPGHFARSFLPVATGTAARTRDAVLAEVGREPPLDFMLRTPRYKWWIAKGADYLFDMETDPFEQNNLAASPDHRETLRQMRDQMLSQLMLTQVSLAAGSKSKVQRAREAASSAKPDREAALKKKGNQK